jgi:hypothetical protein
MKSLILRGDEAGFPERGGYSLEDNMQSAWRATLDSAVGKNREPREPRENKGQGETLRSQKAFTQWGKGQGFRNP